MKTYRSTEDKFHGYDLVGGPNPFFMLDVPEHVVEICAFCEFSCVLGTLV